MVAAGNAAALGRWLVAATLACTAILKVLYPADAARFLSGAGWVYGVALAEASVAVAITIRPRWVVPYGIVLILAVIGLTLAVTGRSDRCGCLGPVHVSREVHAAMCTLLGALALAAFPARGSSARAKDEASRRSSAVRAS